MYLIAFCVSNIPFRSIGLKPLRSRSFGSSFGFSDRPVRPIMIKGYTKPRSLTTACHFDRTDGKISLQEVIFCQKDTIPAARFRPQHPSALARTNPTGRSAPFVACDPLSRRVSRMIRTVGCCIPFHGLFRPRFCISFPISESPGAASRFALPLPSNAERRQQLPPLPASGTLAAPPP